MKKIKCISIIFIFIFAFIVVHNILAEEKYDNQSKWLVRSKFGFQMYGKHKATYLGSTGTEDVNVGVSIGAEFLYVIHKNVELGVGLEYQFEREQERFPGGFNFAPIFAVLRIPFNLKLIEPYAIGRIGYNFYFGDAQYTGTGINYSNPEGGLFYSFGAGISITAVSFTPLNYVYNFFFEANYSVNNGSGNIIGDPIKVTYTDLALYIGVESRY